MQEKGIALFCALLFVILTEIPVVEGNGTLGNSAALSNFSASSSLFGDYCCKLDKKGSCCTYGDCCGTTCCGEDDQCFFDKCINTWGLSKTWSIVVAVAVVVAVIIIIILIIGLCFCCCRSCGSSKHKKTSSKDYSDSQRTVYKGTAVVELEEGKGFKNEPKAPAPAPAPKEKTPEELEAEQKEKECEKKFNSLIRPITEILEVYNKDKISIDDGTEMMVLVVMRHYLEIESGDQDGIMLYTNTGTKVLDDLYAKFYKLVPAKEKNAFIRNIFENLAEKKTEIVKACEGDFAAALAPAAKTIKTAAELVRATALTQDHSILIIGAALATIITAKKITENKPEDENAFEEWFNSLKVYLPKEHADYLKAASWEYAFESIQ